MGHEETITESETDFQTTQSAGAAVYNTAEAGQDVLQAPQSEVITTVRLLTHLAKV